MLGGLIQLVKAVLDYDFIGASIDESTDDMGTVHVPTSWKSSEIYKMSLFHFFNNFY